MASVFGWAYRCGPGINRLGPKISPATAVACINVRLVDLYIRIPSIFLGIGFPNQTNLYVDKYVVLPTQIIRPCRCNFT